MKPLSIIIVNKEAICEDCGEKALPTAEWRRNHILSVEHKKGKINGS